MYVARDTFYTQGQTLKAGSSLGKYNNYVFMMGPVTSRDRGVKYEEHDLRHY